MRRHIRRPSAALVIACGALLVALSGTSVASVTQALPANSVGEVQLRASAVTSEKVKDETLQIVDIAPRARAALTGPAGPIGHQGPKGAKGDPGLVGIAGLEIVQAKTPKTSKNGKNISAYCRGGRRVIGGGASASDWTILPDHIIALNDSEPVRTAPSGGRNRDGWHAAAIELSPKDISWSLTAFAICAFVD
jgi:rhodanese-related sulfurtransferase